MKANSNKAEEKRIKIIFQLDSQSRETLESLSAQKIKKSIALDTKIFQNHKISMKAQ
jgi:hypothetical protein